MALRQDQRPEGPGPAADRVGAALVVEPDRGRDGDLLQEGDVVKPRAPETKVFNRLDGEPGTILNRFSPDEYEVMTDYGIEVVAGRGHPDGGRRLTSQFRIMAGTRNRTADSEAVMVTEAKENPLQLRITEGKGEIAEEADRRPDRPLRPQGRLVLRRLAVCRPPGSAEVRPSSRRQAEEAAPRPDRRPVPGVLQGGGPG